MENIRLPLMIQTMLIEKNGRTIYYPQIVNHWDMNVQAEMNKHLFNVTEQLIKDQYTEQAVTQFDDMIGSFEIKTNERDVLSVSFSNYAIAPFYAHGLTLMKSITMDIRNGKTYNLSDLFKQSSPYIERISTNVKAQIKRRQIPVLEPFTSINENQDFYIADKVLIIYFQVYALTPGYYGFPMFPISVYDLEDMIIEDGPLGRMLGA